METQDHFSPLPLELQFNIFNYLTFSDFKTCLKTFRGFRNYIHSMVIDICCYSCKNQLLDVKNDSQKNHKYKFCVGCDKAICKLCLERHRYNHLVVGQKTNHYLCEKCNPDWWKAKYICNPVDHERLLCKVDHCGWRSKNRIYNKDKLTYLRSCTSPCKVVIYQKGSYSKFRHEGKWWTIHPEHNVKVSEFISYRGIPRDFLRVAEHHEETCDKKECQVAKTRRGFYY